MNVAGKLSAHFVLACRGPIFAILVVGAALLSPWTAHAQALSASETARLSNGEIVEHRSATEHEGRRYVGGTVYALVEGSPAELDAVLADASSYQRILPYTKEARLVGQDGGDLLVLLKQGTALFDATYTVRVRRLAQGHGVQFWVDRSRPHGIEDARGYLRYEPLAERSPRGRSFLVYGIEVDLGPGLVRTFFEGTIQRIVLKVPERLRAYLASAGNAGG